MVVLDKATENGVARIREYAEAWCRRNIDRTPSITRRDPAAAAAEPDTLEASSYHVAERGYAGSHYVGGRHIFPRATPEYDHPWIARGVGFDHGRFDQLFRQSAQYQRAVFGAMMSAKSALWRVQTAPGHTKPQFAEMQTRSVQSNFDALEGGFGSFITQAVVSLLVNHFAIFEVVDNVDGTVRKLAFRRPSTVREWCLNEQQTELLGVIFDTADGGRSYVPAEHILLISFCEYGLDFESIGPMRSAAPWIVAKQVATQIWLGGAQKYGTDVIAVERSQQSPGGTKYASLWDHFDATDFPLIELAPGDKIVRLGASGSGFDFEAANRYFDEQILLPLSAESALVGLNRVGAYNVLEGKESEREAVALYVIGLIEDALNGSGNTPYTGIIPRMIDHQWGGAVDGICPKMVAALGEGDSPLADIYEALDRGLIQQTDALSEYIAQRLKVPQ